MLFFFLIQFFFKCTSSSHFPSITLDAGSSWGTWLEDLGGVWKGVARRVYLENLSGCSWLHISTPTSYPHAWLLLPILFRNTVLTIIPFTSMDFNRYFHFNNILLEYNILRKEQSLIPIQELNEN